MQTRKQLWREVQDYAHSSGLVIKKLPINLLKSSERWSATGHGDPTKSIYAATQRFRTAGMHSSMRQQLMSFTNDPDLQSYIDEVMDGLPFSKHANIFAFFTASPVPHTIRPMRLIGLATTGTFNPHRSAGGTNFTYQSQGMAFNNSVAELELVVANPNTGSGKAITLWVLGELLSKKSGGGPRYTHVVALVRAANMQNIVHSIGFQFRQCREVHTDGTIRNMPQHGAGDKLEVLSATIPHLSAIRNLLRFERPALYDICPPGGPMLGGVSGWQVCK